MSDENTLSRAGTYLDFASLARLKGEAGQDPKKALRAGAEQFEAYFIQEALKAMRKTVEKSDLLNSDHADMYQDLFDKEISVQIARRGGVGLADMLEREMKRREDAALPSTLDALALHPQATPLPLERTRSPLPIGRDLQKAYPIDTIDRTRP